MKIGSIPDLPTDNLYKFLATAGALIFLVSLAVTVWEKDRFNRLQAEIDARFQYTEFLLKESEPIKIDLSSLPEDPNDKIESLEILLQNEKQKITRLREIQTYRTETKKLLGEAKLHIEGAVLKPARLGIIFGLFVSIFGFCLWYIKVQRHLDSFLKNQVSETNVYEDSI